MADFISLLPAGTGSTITGTAHDTNDVKDEATFQLVSGAGVSAAAVTFQGSNDGTNWGALPLTAIAVTTGAPTAATQPVSSAAPGVLFWNLAAGGAWRYFRAVTGTVTGGTVSASVAFGKM